MSHLKYTRKILMIISHPDAGKTTITETITLIRGCDSLPLQKGRKQEFDWTWKSKTTWDFCYESSVMQVEYDGNHINIADNTQEDFLSEDTYRTYGRIVP